MTKSRFLAVASLLSLLLCPTLQAVTYVVPSDEAMVQRADAIVTGTVLTSYAQAYPGGAVGTITEVSVEEVIKGDVGSHIVRIQSPGGQLGSLQTIISGAPRYVDGEHVLLFLSGSASRGWGTTDLGLGKLTFRTDGAGRKLVERQEEITGWDVNGQPHAEKSRLADSFLSFIRSRVAGTPAAQTDYVVASAPRLRIDDVTPRTGTDAVGSPLTYSMSNSSNTSPGFRWNVFPNQVSWVNENTLAGAPNGGVTAIQTAVGNWTNDCGSNINYVYTGANAAATGHLNAADGKNAYHFNVNLNTAFYGNIPPYTCGSGGTIAIGGITSATSPHNHPVSGESFYTTVEGDVDVNQGLANCSFSASEGFNTAMVHETGHTLGFRHSNQDRVNGACPSNFDCSSSAIMTSSVVNGLNGVLQQWDINAARAVYPGGSCTTGAGKLNDFNGDLTADILLRNTSSGQLWLYLMNGANIIGSSSPITVSDLNWKIVATGDFNGDGKTDMYWRNSSTGQNWVYLMNGATIIGSASPNTVADQNWQVQGAGDFDGDGKADVLWRNVSDGQNYVHFMNGTTMASSGFINTVSDLNFKVAAIGDFNGDGKADIYWRHATSGQNWIYLMNGAAIIGSASPNTVADLSWTVVGSGDFNGDGKADVFWRNTSNGQNYIHFMNGTMMTTSGQLTTVTDQSYKVVKIGDFNNDGKADLLWRSGTTGDNYIWFVNGASFTSSFVNTVADQTWQVAGKP